MGVDGTWQQTNLEVDPSPKASTRIGIAKQLNSFPSVAVVLRRLRSFERALLDDYSYLISRHAVCRIDRSGRQTDGRRRESVRQKMWKQRKNNVITTSQFVRGLYVRAMMLLLHTFANYSIVIIMMVMMMMGSTHSSPTCWEEVSNRAILWRTVQSMNQVASHYGVKL